MSTVLMNEMTIDGQTVLTAGRYLKNNEAGEAVTIQNTEILLAKIYHQIDQAKDQCFRLRYYLDELKA